MKSSPPRKSILLATGLACLIFSAQAEEFPRLNCGPTDPNSKLTYIHTGKVDETGPGVIQTDVVVKLDGEKARSSKAVFSKLELADPRHHRFLIRYSFQIDQDEGLTVSQSRDNATETPSYEGTYTAGGEEPTPILCEVDDGPQTGPGMSGHN